MNWESWPRHVRSSVRAKTMPPAHAALSTVLYASWPSWISEQHKISILALQVAFGFAYSIMANPCISLKTNSGPLTLGHAESMLIIQTQSERRSMKILRPVWKLETDQVETFTVEEHSYVGATLVDSSWLPWRGELCQLLVWHPTLGEGETGGLGPFWP